jgi:hypothetical protein
MRKTLTALLLTASLPAFASIADDVKNDISAADIAATAAEGCAGNSGCLEAALKEMLDAGLALETVATAAALAGIGIATFTNAAKSAGFDGGPALVAFQNASLAVNAPASGSNANVNANAKTPGKPAGSNTGSGSNNRPPATATTTPEPISPTQP